jgi:hypothetical protein
MYIAYSALRETDARPQKQTNEEILQHDTYALQLQGYLAACAKYSREIAAIQQYLPGWMPELK